MIKKRESNFEKKIVIFTFDARCYKKLQTTPFDVFVAQVSLSFFCRKLGLPYRNASHFTCITNIKLLFFSHESSMHSSFPSPYIQSGNISWGCIWHLIYRVIFNQQMFQKLASPSSDADQTRVKYLNLKTGRNRKLTLFSRILGNIFITKWLFTRCPT